MMFQYCFIFLASVFSYVVEIFKHLQEHPLLSTYLHDAQGSSSKGDYLEVARKFGADRVLRKPFTPMRSCIHRSR